MQTWDVIRREGDGGTFRVAAHDSRISALAQVLVLAAEETEGGAGREYRVEGPPGPAVRTNRDLYLVFLHLGQEARAASWSLSAFLRSLWRVSAPLSGRPRLEPDYVAAMFAAASTTPPAAFDPAWSGKDLSLPGDEPDRYADWNGSCSPGSPTWRTSSPPPGAPRAVRRRRAPPARLRRPRHPGPLVQLRPGHLPGVRRRRQPRRLGRRRRRPRAAARPARGAPGPLLRPHDHHDDLGDLARIAVCGQVYE